MKVYIVEDAPETRKDIANALAPIKDIEVVGEAESVCDARKGIYSSSPEAVILEMFDDWIRTAMYVAGFVGCLGGFLLIWKDLAAAAVLSLARPKGNFFGEFRLNGYFLEAYEREGENGSKQFRLVSSLKMESEREAACIRYLVNEGLIEELWTRMSQKIKEEADWAFFG